MPTKRPRAASKTSPKKRQKSSDDGTERYHDAFATRIISSHQASNKREDETNLLPLQAGLDENLDQYFYTVQPAAWSTMKRYATFNISGIIFKDGDDVFVKAGPPTPDESAMPEILKSRWVGRVLECRAYDEQRVFLRVVWYLRPEDIDAYKHKRQPHHGTHELVASNDTNIIEAVTVDGMAEVVYWNEDDDDEEPKDGVLFWRQSMNCAPDCKPQESFSRLRLHCICEAPSNPDKLLLKCDSSSCGKWIHDECLVHDLAQKIRSNTVTLADCNGSRKAKIGKSRKKSSGIPATIERVFDSTTEISGPVPSIFQITFRDKPLESFTVSIEKRGKTKSVYRFLSTNKSGHSKMKPWEEEIKCLACDSVIE